MLDHAALDWENVAVATYHIQQTFRYEYPGPIFDLSHRLVALPRSIHADQRTLSRSLSVWPHATPHRQHDPFGNEVFTFDLESVDQALEIEIDAIVQRSRVNAEHTLAPEVFALPAFREASALTGTDAALADAAASLRTRYGDDRRLAEAIVDYVHGEIAYTKGVTDTATTAAAAFAARQGVCQDFAHVALALARACNLPGRYVSGHLLGEGATHAWVEFFFAGHDGHPVSLSFDPTYGCATTLGYVVVAVGRDYSDVAPTSGVYRAPYAGTLEARTHVRVRDVGYR